MPGGEVFRSRRPVAFGDVDYARILYYPKLLHYCHQAFEAFVGEVAGMHYSEFLSVADLGFPAVRAEVDYILPIPYGVDLELSVQVLAIGTKSLTLRYRGRIEKDEPFRVEAKVTTVLVKMATFESLAIPDDIRRNLERFMVPAKASPKADSTG
ncbi:MAG: thioesterase family protein [Planctomycetota bacterium]